MTMREKSAWATLAGMMIVFGPYFVSVFGRFARGQLDPATVLGLFVAAVVFLVVLMTVLGIAIGVVSRREPVDERDRAIEARSFKVGYFTFASAAVVLILGVTGATWISGPAPGPLSVQLLVQLFLLCLVLAETAKALTQIVAYRRGS
jgi:hypothetical protein